MQLYAPTPTHRASAMGVDEAAIQYNIYAFMHFLPHNFSLRKSYQHTIKVGSWLLPYFAEENYSCR